MQKNKFGDHMVLAERNPNKLTFRVDNTRSGTSKPDSVMKKVKEIFVAMVWSLWSERDAIPLPWAVLDKLLGTRCLNWMTMKANYSTLKKPMSWLENSVTSRRHQENIDWHCSICLVMSSLSLLIFFLRATHHHISGLT